MYWLDTLILALLVLGAALGFFSGFLWQIARILTLGTALLVTVTCNDPASHFCRDQLLRGADPRVAQAVAYVLVFLVVYLVLFLAARLVYAGIRATDLVAVDRLLGGAFGAGKMALILGACCLAAANYPHQTTRDWMAKSALAPTFSDAMEHVLYIIPDEYKENLRGTLVSLREMLSRPGGDAQAESKLKI
ncbi:MAG TPA: CvpA family protein [Gemmataceae bacterium]|jgi:membrane protein required for colicin V production|nr:CvpA family protein [Gemmataceae bacterium]